MKKNIFKKLLGFVLFATNVSAMTPSTPDPYLDGISDEVFGSRKGEALEILTNFFNHPSSGPKLDEVMKEIFKMTLTGENLLNSQSKIVGAIQIRDIDALRTLITDGEDINQKDSDGLTPLMHAVKSSAVTILKISSPRSNGKIAIAELLINRGAEIDLKDNDLKTALMFAAESNNVEGIHLLLNSGANINLVDKFGMSPLMFAARNCCLETVQCLVERGANIYTICTSNHLTARGFAILSDLDDSEAKMDVLRYFDSRFKPI
jgi:hypothetical protein